MSPRLLLPSLFLALAPAARADLELTLRARVPQAASPRKTAAGARTAARRRPNPAAAIRPAPEWEVRGALASRSAARQVGVARRGAAPVLPPVGDLGPALAPEPPQAVAISARLGRTLPTSTDVYRLPDPRSAWVSRLGPGQHVAVVSQWQGWYAIVMGDGSLAYLPQTHLELLPYRVRSVAPAAPVPAVNPAGPPQTTASSPLARGVIEAAFTYEGVPYVWGGNTGRGIDCSGLVRNCFAAQGVQLPRRASHQAMVGQEVPLDQVQPGDRLYFSVKKQFDHTGIYLGDGYFIHASMSRKKVAVERLDTPLYGRSLAAARRL